jgi:hypothetical protein
VATDDEALAKAEGLAQEYLGRDDLDGGWFALGGSSLDAARLVSALSQQYATQVRLQDLLTADSVATFLRTHLPPPATSAPAPQRPLPPPLPTQPAGPVDILWPALAALPANDRLTLAHRLLGDVLRESTPDH